MAAVMAAVPVALRRRVVATHARALRRGADDRGVGAHPMAVALDAGRAHGAAPIGRSGAAANPGHTIEAGGTIMPNAAIDAALRRAELTDVRALVEAVEGALLDR